MRNFSTWLAVMFISAAWGCDQSPPAPPPPAPKQSAPTQPTDNRPTTREALASPRKTLQLGDFPLKVDVPAKWQLGSLGTTTYLQGPVPNGPLTDGTIHIMFSRLPVFTRDSLSAFEDKEKKSATERKPGQVKLIEFRNLDQARIYESRIVEPARGDVPAAMNWIILVYVPGDKDTYIPYKLSFLDLSLETYEKDKDLLEQIVSSLRMY